MCILIRWVNNVISAQRKTQSPQGQCHISEHKDCENGLRRWKVVESLYARGRGRNNGAWVEGATWNGGGVGSMSRVAWGSFFVVPHISLSDIAFPKATVRRDNGRASPLAGGCKTLSSTVVWQEVWMKASAALNWTLNVPCFPCSPLQGLDYH